MHICILSKVKNNFIYVYFKFHKKQLNHSFLCFLRTFIWCLSNCILKYLKGCPVNCKCMNVIKIVSDVLVKVGEEEISPRFHLCSFSVCCIHCTSEIKSHAFIVSRSFVINCKSSYSFCQFKT